MLGYNRTFVQSRTLQQVKVLFFFVGFCYAISIFTLIYLYGQFYTGVERTLTGNGFSKI